MNRGITIVTILVLAVTVSPCIAENPVLNHNPFERPPSAASLAPRIESDGSVRSFELLATMVIDDQGLANVGGKILHPGDVMQGAKLLKVYEDRAVFLRNGQRLTIYVKPEVVENNE